MIGFFKRIFGRRLLALFSAVVLTVILGVIFQTQNLLSRLSGVGADITAWERLSMTAYDIFRLGSLYIIFVAPALLVAIIICDLIAKRIKFARPVIYALGCAAAILVMLFAMKVKFFDVHLIGGARDTMGIGFQMLAGAMGGLVFYLINRETHPHDI